ncbi:MAG: SPW repeat protein [Proteobacteria bacterium]|nr:SPW repeat protein [Pseudomonadota bacterium]
MASPTTLSVHREWEDWAGIGLGVAITLSPWIARQDGDTSVVLTTVCIGILVLLLAEIGLVGLIRPIEIGELVCGLALAVWPFALGYADAGELRYWHFSLGGFVTLLAAFELWQDWSGGYSQLTAHADS